MSKNTRVFSPAQHIELVASNYFRFYAYTNQVEFLAVILEHFFETPQVFKKEFPELYSNVRDMINFKDEDLFS
jgi:Mlc titration factor MtfA (ptsG expression regulator)